MTWCPCNLYCPYSGRLTAVSQSYDGFNSKYFDI